MATPTSTARIQHIYCDRGKEERLLDIATVAPELSQGPGVADAVSVLEIMSRSVSCVRGELDSEAVADRMIRSHIGCLPVIDDRGVPIGMITKRDLVEQRLGSHGSTREPAPRTAREIMTPLAFTLGMRATIADAAAMMTTEAFHHVAIVDLTGRLIGVVSSLDIVRWVAANRSVIS